MLSEQQARSDELRNCNLIYCNCNPINAAIIVIDAGAAVVGYAGVCGPLSNPADRHDLRREHQRRRSKMLLERGGDSAGLAVAPICVEH